MRIRWRFTCRLLFVNAKNRCFLWVQARASNKTIAAEASISLYLNQCFQSSQRQQTGLHTETQSQKSHSFPPELSETWENMLREWEEESKHLGLFLLLVPANASSVPFFYSSYKHSDILSLVYSQSLSELVSHLTRNSLRPSRCHKNINIMMPLKHKALVS